MTVTVLPGRLVVDAQLQFRLSVTRLTQAQLADLRRAVDAVKQLHDERGFDYWAGVHGLPLPISCEHHTPLFLPWHRAYLYFFELALQDQVPGVTLRWWDWSSVAAHRDGIPPADADEQVDGQPNPLFDAPIPKPPRPIRAARNATSAASAKPTTRPDSRHAGWSTRSLTLATSTTSKVSWRASTISCTCGSAGRPPRSPGRRSTRCFGPPRDDRSAVAAVAAAPPTRWPTSAAAQPAAAPAADDRRANLGVTTLGYEDASAARVPRS